MSKQHDQGGPIESRLISLFVSLFFSVPTAVLLWVWANSQLMYVGGFLGSRYFFGCIVTFSVLALVFPNLFPSMLGSVWRAMVAVWRWWGW